MKKLLPVVVTLAVIALPFLIHFGLHYLSPWVFSLLLWLILLPRILLMPGSKTLGKAMMAAIVSLFCGAIAWFDSGALLRYYPVLMSVFMAMLFLLSLGAERSLIEYFAQLSGKTYPPAARHYMRKLTGGWALLLCGNGAVAAYTACCLSPQLWLLYNGMISYGVMAAFMLLEWVYRGMYQRKYASDTEANSQ